MDSEPIKVNPQEVLTEFPITNSPFERNKNDYSDAHLQHLEKLYGSWDNVKYELGFQEIDSTNWQNNHHKILEVGPGMGVSTKQLLEKGIDIYALEPSLKYLYIESKDALANKRKKILLEDQFINRISSANATDTPYAFPNMKFHVAFAIGTNFQCYARTAESLVNQIDGVMASLDETDSSFFTFTINENGLCRYNINKFYTNNEQFFQLDRFLNDARIKYKTIKFRDDSMLEEYAIRIYSKSPTGTSSALLSNFVNQDLSQYITET